MAKNKAVLLENGLSLGWLMISVSGPHIPAPLCFFIDRETAPSVLGLAAWVRQGVSRAAKILLVTHHNTKDGATIGFYAYPVSRDGKVVRTREHWFPSSEAMALLRTQLGAMMTAELVVENRWPRDEALCFQKEITFAAEATLNCYSPVPIPVQDVP